MKGACIGQPDGRCLHLEMPRLLHPSRFGSNSHACSIYMYVSFTRVRDYKDTGWFTAVGVTI